MANTTKKRTTEPEKEIAATLADYPDPMSRTDFRKACHIGTRTSIYLLQSGLVPCHNTGKRTRCYRTAKADVTDYLRRRAAAPAPGCAPPALPARRAFADNRPRPFRVRRCDRRPHRARSA